MFDFEKPKIEIAEISEDKTYGKFVVEPLERGYGTTLGNSLRRIMLSSLPGAGFRKRVKCTAGFRSNDLLSRRSIHCTEIDSHSRCPDRRIMKLSENRAL